MARPHVDYERHGRTYARQRRSDPRIAARIHAALGDARTVLNVGAGTGSYEPVDAAMACVTIHHWEPPEAGLAELRRVASGPVVVFTFDLDCLPAWQLEHLAEGLEIEGPRFPEIDAVATALGGRTCVERIPTPGDCVDGFFEAYWRRPEALLDPAVRAAQSMWALVGPDVEQRIVERLAAALASGAWDAEHGHLREQEAFDGGLRLVVSEPQPEGDS